uniref:Small capsomere-interacting protein n=1 Tax=Bovine herpesvirus 4 TaxID=10385 RepID=G1EUM1_BHV4|nr:hypothetical protein [Bovine gammaherpesvirus 4]
MSQHRLRTPMIQGRLENDYPNNPLIATMTALPQNNMTSDQYAEVQRNYLVFLIAQQCYDRYLASKTGIRRKHHLQQLLSHIQPPNSSIFSSLSSQASAPTAPPPSDTDLSQTDSRPGSLLSSTPKRSSKK